MICDNLNNPDSINPGNPEKNSKTFEEENLVIENSEVHRILLDESPDPIFSFTPDGRYIYVNNAFATGVQKTVEQIKGKKIWDVFGKEEGDKRYGALKSVFDSGEEKVIEVRVPRTDEDRYYITTITPIKDKNNKVITCICSSKDITDRKRVELALKQSEARLNSFMKFVPAFILIKDSDSRILFASENFNKFFQITDWIGKKPHETFRKEAADEMLLKDREALEKGYTAYEETWNDKAGVEHIYFTQKFRIDIEDGKPLIGAMITDITEVKEKEDNLKESYEKYKHLSDKLQTLNAAKDQFLSIISHDLRGPYQGFLGMTEILMNEFRSFSDEELETTLREIHAGLRAQYELLEDLLQWSRLRIGGVNYAPSRVSIIDEITNVIQSVYFTFKNKNLSLNCSISENLFAEADPNMLRTLVRNLVNNAVKFSYQDGQIEINAREVDLFIEISVSDKGKGIDEEDIPKLFRRDVQHTSTGTEGEHGSGLGLVLCREIVDQHGGKIWVESKKNEGSTFYFTLPKSE